MDSDPLGVNAPADVPDALKVALDRARDMGPGLHPWLQPGQMLGGVVEEFATDRRSDGNLEVFVILTPSGQRRRVALSSSLARQVEEHEVKVGDTVGIVYHGEVPTKAGRRMKAFTLLKLSAGHEGGSAAQ